MQELVNLLHPGGLSRGFADVAHPGEADVSSSTPGSEGASTGEISQVHAAFPKLRRAIDAFDCPEDGPTRSLAELSAAVVGMNAHRLEARYGLLAEALPDLLAELARASQAVVGGHERRQVEALRALALRAADGLAFKFGYLDLSSRLIDLMRHSAALSDDQLLVAAAEYVRTETFFANGDLTAARRLLIRAADEPSLSSLASPRVAAAYGSLQMRTAVVAGRMGDRSAAHDHLREAYRAASTVPEGVYHGTAFGPHSLRIHELAVAAELRDPAGVQRAAAWHPPKELPAERRSHYYIELGRVQLELGRHDDAHQCVELAREAAPQHTREHPQVRSTVATLLRYRPGNSRLVDLAAWTGARVF
ncbi:hypothetical protein V1227_08300 [Lentzea sp. DG1S-22]|uniref:hypothetical protein n=1 Tax=Lentzea sp. DG1S-22 TaxID=3108822 RepID=UPI002E78C375|nr:hypothetical protein [Lentzea sp. DG1S-22]WVH82743.1 hypothetical protein V1227_08300 [Lentzea sp. DG1S-22]